MKKKYLTKQQILTLRVSKKNIQWMTVRLSDISKITKDENGGVLVGQDDEYFYYER